MVAASILHFNRSVLISASPFSGVLTRDKVGWISRYV